jgi:hypothetical protein
VGFWGFARKYVDVVTTAEYSILALGRQESDSRLHTHFSFCLQRPEEFQAQ